MAWWRKSVSERKAREVPHQYEIKLDELDARVSHMEEQVRRMRGYVYARKGLVGPPGEPMPGDDEAPAATPAPRAKAAPAAPAVETRDDIRRRLVRTGAFVPGRPPNHGE